MLSKLLLTPGLLKEHSDERAEVSLLIGEGIVECREAPPGDVLHRPDILHVSWVLALAGYPHCVGFRLAGLEGD